MDTFDTVMLGIIIIGLVFIITVCTITGQYNKDITELGSKMCAERGFQLDVLKTSYGTTMRKTSIQFVFKNETPIEDGYLVMSS